MKLFFVLISFHLSLAVLGLGCCARAFSSCGERGPLFAAVRGFLIAVASPTVEHGPQARRLQQLWHRGLSSHGSRAPQRRLSSCGAQAQSLCGTWDLPRKGIEPVSPALASGLPATVPPGEPPKLFS